MDLLVELAISWLLLWAFRKENLRVLGLLPSIKRIENLFYVQENTDKGEIIIKHFETEVEAMNLVNDRMEIYDKMWDGCGCKINYYE